jgi:hypothetical protein
MVLITIAAGLTLLAWWLSVRNSRRTRALIAYLEQNHETFWRSLPSHSRNFNRVGAIEAYRRSDQIIDPNFLVLYQARKSGARAQISTIIIALALIGVVPIGTALWGWHW